jgi:RimJ/RimL family protein N-acetyltransferase
MQVVRTGYKQVDAMFKLVDSLREAMIVRSLRNSCREDLTNHREHIGVAQQVRWYFRSYRQSKRLGSYRLYLLYSDARPPVGYGALALRDRQLYVTECVGRDHRGLGHGRSILAELMSIASQEQRDLVAEIWAENQRSITLHVRAGFTLLSRDTKRGKVVETYCLRARSSEEQ